MIRKQYKSIFRSEFAIFVELLQFYGTKHDNLKKEQNKITQQKVQN